MKQIFLFAHNIWADIAAESELFYRATDVDGVVTYVLKDGLEQIRTQQ